MAKSELQELSEQISAWSGEDATRPTAIIDAGRNKRTLDRKSSVYPSNPAEKADFDRQVAAARAKEAAKVKTELKPLLLRISDLRTELISNRLHPLENTDLPPDKQMDPLFDKLRSGNYERQDVYNAYDYMMKLQKRFESTIK